MLKTRTNIQRGSELLKNLSKNAAKAHSVVVGVDNALKHVSNNKAFDKAARDRASNIQGYSQAVSHVLSGDFVKSAQKAARPWTQKETAEPFKLMSREKMIPTHVRTTKKHEHRFFGDVNAGIEDLYA